MVATSGSKLLNDNAADTLKARLLPLAAIITPNIPEAEVLSGFSIDSRDDMLHAAEDISKMVPGSILIKGGHLTTTSDDLLYTNGKPHWFLSPKINNPNTHGTGCTLSSAIACNLAAGYSLIDSIKNAKDYITGALMAGLDLGKGSGPLNHCYRIML